MLPKLSSSVLAPSLRIPAAIICFSNVLLPFCDVVVHLGLHLHYDLSDDADILSKARDLDRKANLMLCTFSAADPVVKTRLLQSYCLALYGCSLWKLSCSSIRSIEVSFNNILRVSGNFHEIVTLVFSTSLPACPVYLILVHRHFCYLPYPVHPWLSVRSFETRAC